MGRSVHDWAFSRRSVLRLLAGVAIAGTARSSPLAAPPRGRTTMGLVIYDCGIRRRWMREQRPGFDLFEPMNFLRHCHSLGAGGMQARLGVLAAKEINELREFAEQHDLFIEAIISPPEDQADLTRFEKEIETARDVGVQAARTVIMPGRRYERFKTFAEFKEYELRGRKMLERAAAVVEKHRVPLAVENHKDQRIDARIGLFEDLGSEFIGACVDTGNSFALLDDPYQAVEALAPYAFSVHLKDQAVQEYEEGFLLGDIPLGEGSFDLKRMVNAIQGVKPDVRFSLELITRDALQVPCLNESYWSTMQGVPGSDLARTLRFVRENPAELIQRVSGLPLASQVAREDANIDASLRFAATELGLRKS